MKEIVGDLKHRVLQGLARVLPGATTVRPMLHRWRGVQMGTGVFIGTDALIETAYPELVSIGDRVVIGIRAVIIAHFREEPRSGHSVRIGDDVYIGPGAIVLPNVTIGAGAVITAGTVVTRSVPPLTMVAGNPGVPVARSRIALGLSTAPREYYRSLTPIRQRSRSNDHA